MKNGFAQLMINYSPRLILAGGLAIAASRITGGAGVLTAFSLIWLGACGASCRDHATERGVWLLSGLFLLLSCTFLVVLIVGMARDSQPFAGLQTFEKLDGSLAVLILLLQVVFLYVITLRNLATKPDSR